MGGMSDVLKAACVAVVAMALIAGCATGVPGYADNHAGRSSAREMCNSVRSFVRASLDEDGLRRAWFLPFGSYDDGSFDFYAPMASDPSDVASMEFHEKRVGQLTHYLSAPDFAEALATCLSRSEGFERTNWQRSGHTARAAFNDLKYSRKVVIDASDSTTRILIAAGAWNGDVKASMAWPGPGEAKMPPAPSFERTREP